PAGAVRQDRDRAWRRHRCLECRCRVLVARLPHQSERGSARLALSRARPRSSDATLLIDATPKHPMPPFALPAREFMERAKVIWDELGLPELNPQPPWYGYSLGDWSDIWDKWAKAAVEGRWEET